MKLSDYLEVVSSSGHVLHFKLKRFWDHKFHDVYSEAFYQEFQLLVDKFHGENFIVLADLSEFATPSDASKALIGKCMKYALDHGLYKSVQVIPQLLAKRGIDRAAEENTSTDFRVPVKDIEAAKEMVQELKVKMMAKT